MAKNFKLNVIIILGSLLGITACNTEDSLPRPKAFLALEYPKALYFESELDCPFTFKYNTLSNISPKQNNNCWLDIDYPKLKGSIYLSYYPVEDNLKALLIDAQKLPLSHEIKADAIASQTYINKENGTYGLFYEIEGNAASQAQFYLTDSLNHFVTASIYFKAIPNYDSILPAAAYLKNDMRVIMESLEWKD
jgi:gliding motility-associated lipoprotein GldD